MFLATYALRELAEMYEAVEDKTAFNKCLDESLAIEEFEELVKYIIKYDSAYNLNFSSDTWEKHVLTEQDELVRYYSNKFYSYKYYLYKYFAYI